MAIVPGTNINALAQPNPRKTGARPVPHFLYIPEKAFGADGQTLSFDIYDPEGHYDKKTSSYKPATVTYLFLRGNATPVGKESHVLPLMRQFAQLGIVELAVVKESDKVEYFHPERTNKLDIKINGNYYMDRYVEFKTPVYKPAKGIVLRTGAEVAAGKKLHLDVKERFVSAETILENTAVAEQPEDPVLNPVLVKKTRSRKANKTKE